ESVVAGLDRLLANPDVDLILALGPLASMEAGRRGRLTHPVVAPFVLDAEAQGIPRTEQGTSGVPGLTYLESPAVFARDLSAFHEIVSFRHFAFVANRSLLEAVPGIATRLRESVQPMGIDVTIVPAAGTAKDVLALIPPDADAVYVVPLIELLPGEFDRFVEALADRKIPSFSFLGREDVERGILAGLTADSIFPRYARRTGLQVQRVLLGEKPESLPVAMSRREELSLNLATAKAIGVRPTFRILTEAVLVDNQSTPPARTIGLLDVLTESVMVNRDLIAQEHAVAAASQDTRKAKARLLPQIDVNATGVVIDGDRAEASLGSAAERTLTGAATVSQILWSESALAGLAIQSDLQVSREAELERARLDVALDAATAYLQLLRAKTLERIRRDDLRLTRSNLELARIRESLGISGPADVYRWESRIADGRKASIEANAQRNLAEMALNEILHRPLEEPFATVETELTDPALPDMGAVGRYIEDPWSFRIFRRYMTEHALATSLELQQIDAAIAAQERARTSARRSFYSPTLALQGQVAQELASGGAGSGGSGLSIPGLTLPSADDTDWNVSLRLSLPLFNGGSRIADVTQASEELTRLRTQREGIADRIEQRMRSALHVAGASYAAIALARESSEAAQKNLELVTDAYSRGVLEVIDLLDAQNVAVAADQAASDAVHDFLLDLFQVERASGKFTFMVPEPQRQAWFDSLQQYFDAATRDGE
ncbi:MAG: TolC family protein, partial [Candidatus Eisenbacteria bacterium]|nr:TolC family protein [Candidatus Eisenbacteria bacterium]